MDYYSPCSFANIQGYPHDLLDDSAINKIPTFWGNNYINVEAHIKKFNMFLEIDAHVTT